MSVSRLGMQFRGPPRGQARFQNGVPTSYTDGDGPMVPWWIERYEPELQTAKPGLSVSAIAGPWNHREIRLLKAQSSCHSFTNCVGDAAHVRSSGCGFVLSCLCARPHLRMRISSIYMYMQVCSWSPHVWAICYPSQPPG